MSNQLTMLLQHKATKQYYRFIMDFNTKVPQLTTPENVVTTVDVSQIPNLYNIIEIEIV